MASPVKDRKPAPLPAPNSDFYELIETLPAEELAVVQQVRTFMETKVAPIITKYWVEDAFPFEILPAIKELNIGGVGMQGYGCRGGSAQLFGLVAMEMARFDSSIATFFGVHNGLAMGSIYLGGSEEQKQKWLPPMARWEKIGCFGLTEPLVGSGTSGGMLTTAKRDGDTWILNGQKKWIGNSPWCDISIIWARDVADNQVKAFIVENKTTPGFTVEKIQNKIALKVVQNGLITMENCRIPEANRLQQDQSFRDTARVLKMTRFMVGWEATGIATLTLLTYLFVYTPLKRKTPMCVLVEAIPGAMPPLIGWAAASGRLNIEAGILYVILFLWQFPHFMAIAWMYREDYDRAGYLVLPKGNARVPFVILETLLPLLALVAISMMQSPTRHTSAFYCAAALMGAGFTYFGWRFVFERSRIAARRLLMASIVYLPLLFGLSATLCNRAR